VQDVIGVQVVHCLQGLGEELEGLGFREDAAGVLVVEEVAAFGVLEDEVEQVAVEECLPQAGDVRVVHFSVQLDLPFHQPHLRLRGQFLHVDLHGASSTIFTAYMRAVGLWRARNTVPKDPHPSFRSGSSWNSSMEENLCLGTILTIRKLLNIIFVFLFPWNAFIQKKDRCPSGQDSVGVGRYGERASVPSGRIMIVFYS
jgi:hypothetical protein